MAGVFQLAAAVVQGAGQVGDELLGGAVPAALAGQVDLPPAPLDVVPGIFGKVDGPLVAWAAGQLLVDKHGRPQGVFVDQLHGNPRLREEGCAIGPPQLGHRRKRRGRRFLAMSGATASVVKQ